MRGVRPNVVVRGASGRCLLYNVADGKDGRQIPGGDGPAPWKRRRN
ncbi:hypothetical protein HMPREF1868_00865 [Olsenella sp. DNF00959]|nr:hypothetical protein HMPREF1868_00865 [Olsenella sp. DNF00959]